MTAARTPIRSVSALVGAAGVPLHHLKQIGHLLSGNAMSTGLTLIGTGIAARTLTTATFGIFVMILTFVRLVERIARFESWQPLIKFASGLEAECDRARLTRLYLYGLLLDVGAAALAASSALAIAWLFAPLVGISPAYLPLVAICCIGTLFNITGMPTAALRLAGSFRTIAYSQLIGPTLLVFLSAHCGYRKLGIEGFLIATIAAQIRGALVFVYQGFAALRAQRIGNPLRASPRGLRREFPGFMAFAWSTNLSMTMRTLTQEADTLLVGALSGPSAAGFYHIAKRLAKLAQQFGAQAQAVLYPDMARLWAKGNVTELRALTLRIQWALGVIGIAALLAALLLGHTVIVAALGRAYADATPLLVTQIISVIFVMHAAPSRSILLSMGRPQLVLIVAAIGTAIFFACALLLIPRIGAMGASIAQIVFTAFIALWLDIAWHRGIASPSRTVNGNDEYISNLK